MDSALPASAKTPDRAAIAETVTKQRAATIEALRDWIALPTIAAEKLNTTAERNSDEWVGNALIELWAPDCVSWGTAERHRATWPTQGPASEQKIAPGFRMSPQVVRVTLLAKSETTEIAGGQDVTEDFFNKLFPIEDRPETDSIVGTRAYETLTERFSPRNLHWRPADVL